MSVYRIIKTYVATLVDAFPNDEVDEHPTENQHSEQFPSHGAHILQAVSYAQNAVTRMSKSKSKIKYICCWLRLVCLFVSSLPKLLDGGYGLIG